MKDAFTHWDGTPTGAVALQKELREQVRLVPLKKPIQNIRTIGGCDVSMNRFATQGFAGFVTLAYPAPNSSTCALELLDHSVVKEKIRFPYIPGLLSFREVPMLLSAWEKLQQKPDVLVVDGVGIAHPRRMGIATHLGLVLNIPTIGCAKSVLIGEYAEPAPEPGSFSYMHAPRTNEVIGAALRTKLGVKPVFVSPGHLITLSESIEILTSCVRKHRLPEPTRLAHNTVNAYRMRDLEEKN